MPAKDKNSPWVRKFLRSIEQLTNPPLVEQMRRGIEQLTNPPLDEQFRRVVERLLTDEGDPVPDAPGRANATPARARRPRKPERRRRAALWRIIQPWKDFPPDEIEGLLAAYAAKHPSERVWQPGRVTLLKVIEEGEKGEFQ